jgi:uncharacterized protein
VKRCLVVYATPARQWSWTVELAGTASVADALASARAQAAGVDVPWDGDVGIFGESCARDFVPLDGDRIEIYRPLTSDPKESRRARAAARRAERGPAPSPPRSSRPKA